jgi:hypothetical protein
VCCLHVPRRHGPSARPHAARAHAAPAAPARPRGPRARRPRSRAPVPHAPSADPPPPPPARGREDQRPDAQDLHRVPGAQLHGRVQRLPPVQRARAPPQVRRRVLVVLGAARRVLGSGGRAVGGSAGGGGGAGGGVGCERGRRRRCGQAGPWVGAPRCRCALGAPRALHPSLMPLSTSQTLKNRTKTPPNPQTPNPAPGRPTPASPRSSCC